MSKPNYNVDDYTVTELLEILGLEDPTTDDIVDATNKYIAKFTAENRPSVVTFFQEMQTKLVQYMNALETSGEDAEYAPDETQTNNWFKYEALPQDDVVQKDKNTDRIQKIDIYDNNHMPMNREQLGVNNTHEVPVVQDTLNPNLKNVTNRFINLDSQFRQASGSTESMSTDYTLDLSDPLTDVLSLRLYSIQIPYTWYTIDYIYGNTCFWVTNQGNTFKIFVEPGNYSPSEFTAALNNAFTNAKYFKPPYTNTLDENPGPTYSKGFTRSASVSSSQLIAYYNANTGKIALYLDGWIDPANHALVTVTQYEDTFDSETDAYFTFFDISGTKNCYESGTYPCSASQGQGHTFDGTLGWLMGFRLPILPIFSTQYSTDLSIDGGGNIPQGILNLYGTKYLIVVLDDFNQNHINNGLVTITELSKTLPLPSYYNSSQPYICLPTAPSFLNLNAIGNLANISPATSAALGINPDNFINSIQDKLELSTTSNVQQLLPSAPRTLTQAQIYTINEIIKNRNKTISFRSKAPTNSDTFAIIPIKYGSMTTGQLYTELSGQFQDNKRNYFGPVDIDRLRIRLLDDKGNTIDLHGADWCITIISENLYQY